METRRFVGLRGTAIPSRPMAARGSAREGVEGGEGGERTIDRAEERGARAVASSFEMNQRRTNRSLAIGRVASRRRSVVNPLSNGSQVHPAPRSAIGDRTAKRRSVRTERATV